MFLVTPVEKLDPRRSGLFLDIVGLQLPRASNISSKWKGHPSKHPVGTGGFSRQRIRGPELRPEDVRSCQAGQV